MPHWPSSAYRHKPPIDVTIRDKAIRIIAISTIFNPLTLEVTPQLLSTRKLVCMDDDFQNLAELRNKASFLKREKQRLLEAQRKREEIARLQTEVSELSAKEREPVKIVEVDSNEDLKIAVKTGQWPTDLYDNDANLEIKWEQEKLRLEGNKIKGKVDNQKFIWGFFGGLAMFFPIFWPFFILQTFRAYPIVSFTSLGLIVLLLVVLYR